MGPSLGCHFLKISVPDADRLSKAVISLDGRVVTLIVNIHLVFSCKEVILVTTSQCDDPVHIKGRGMQKNACL